MKTTQALKQNSHPSFIIYDASAGSGKTYSLVRSYLQAILHTNHPENYQSILAITFTNKAAYEMKTRVLTQLNEFSSKKILLEPTEMFQEIVKQCGVDKEVIHQRAAKALHHILQNYGHFSITTIDSLTHQIVRTFARDLGLSSTFEVMLETDLLLEQAVDLLIEQTGENKQQTKILTDFVIQKASDNKSWDVSVDLNKIAPLVYNENHYNQLRQMNHKSWNDFLTLQKKIQTQKTACVEAMNKGSEQLYKKVIDSGIEEGSFSYKELIKQLEKGQSSNPKSIPSKRLLSLNENNQILKKSASQSEQSALASMQGDIDQWIEVVTLQQKTLNLLQLIDKQRVPFSALHAIYKTAQDLQKNQDKRLLSSFNPLLFETISELPTPFVYERLGVKYRQIFIDEFQDTSLLQWKNLIPLLDNAISSTDSSILLVGDAKQSIYRWRGGYPEQFIDLTKGITPFPIDPEVIRLSKNYRSQDTIVKTNNTFFKESGAVLSSPDYQNLFKKGADQETNNNPGGAVTFTFVEGNTIEEREPNYLEAIHQQLIDCENRKYKRNEICILVRKRQQGVLITEYLAQQNIDVISAETLLLSQSKKVNVLLSWLQLRINQNDEEARKVILDYFHTDDQDQFIWDREGLKKPIHQFVKQINGDQFDFSFEIFQQKGIYEAVEYTIDALDMATALCPYISGFLEEIIEFTRNTATDDKGFLSHWEMIKDKRSVRLTSKNNAVEVMTIHKAKGLEFPVVIFPFAETTIVSSKPTTHWIDVPQELFAGFSSLLVGLNKDFSETSDSNHAIYEAVKETQALDALNTLYVAMTRPENELHIISHSQLNNSKSYADLFWEFVNNNDLPKLKENQFISGKLTTSQIISAASKPTKATTWITNASVATTIRKSQQSKSQDNGVDFGYVFHEIMSRIYVKTDVEDAIQYAYNQGNISIDQVGELTKLIDELVNHNELGHFFNSKGTQYNERTLFSTEGISLRPDCFVVLPNKEAAILDYKTGKPKPAHEDQLNEYASLLEKLGYTVKKKTIVYISKTVSLKHIY